MILAGFAVAFGAAFGWRFGKKIWLVFEELIEAVDAAVTQIWRGLRGKRDAG